MESEEDVEMPMMEGENETFLNYQKLLVQQMGMIKDKVKRRNKKADAKNLNKKTKLKENI